MVDGGVRSGTEIQTALAGFASKWLTYAGSERAEAQTFLNELFAAYGSDRQAVGALFEDFKSSAGFMDLHWPGIAIFEMKKPGTPLAKAAEQIDRYWRESSDGDTPAARWVVACNFQQFEVWEPGRFPKAPRITFGIDELADHYDALLFLQNDTLEPVFSEHRRELTADAARHIAEFYRSMIDRSAAPVDEIQRFTMQLVWCLFAEDLGMLDGYPLQSTVDALLKETDPDSARDIGYLFSLLNQKGDHNRKGRYSGTRYVNGDLFARPAAVFLTRDELVHLRLAAEFNWREVNPTIFGSLLEGVLGDDRRSEIGAHYTHEADIMKIVAPTIVRPWRERIDGATSVSDAVLVLHELCEYRVLDPACGCGNFLYVAYRELRTLEYEAKRRIDALATQTGAAKPVGPLPYYPLANLYGLDIERVAVMIARVTLWMGHRQMVDRVGEAEPVLPLVDLSNVRAADALRTEWPEVDTIIGNPPFLGSQLIRQSLGDGYVEWLSQHFGVGVRDLCVYWFRIAQQRLAPGQRAGLVGTNSISQNRARDASLEYIVETGGVITDAVSSQRWPGDAKVHVSIVNWVKSPVLAPTAFDLDGRLVPGISATLGSSAMNDWKALPLLRNSDHAFIGASLHGAGFRIAESELAPLGLTDSHVVRPFLDGRDVTTRIDQSPSRFVIDFDEMPLEAATKYERELGLVRSRVKPERDTNNRPLYRTRWWLHGETRPGMRRSTKLLARSAMAGRTGKRLLVTWQAMTVLASDALVVFAFDDDYSMGVLMSRAHDAWAWAQSSTLKGDLRYTPTTAFMTFPWPDPITPAQRDAVAEASVALYTRRSGLCVEHEMGLTKLYNLMDEGAFADLAALHRRLDEAVAAAYGWPKSVAQDGPELVRRLSALNREIADGGRAYAPFA